MEGSNSEMRRASTESNAIRKVAPDAVSLNQMTHSVAAPGTTFGVVFDGDDTLWSTEQLYDGARARARASVEETGLNGAKWEERERFIDVQNVDKMGFSMERFPTSCVQAYEELCRSAGLDIAKGTVERVRQAARSAFKRDPVLVSGARETLTLLRAKGARLALLTKGDHKLQSRRMKRSGLRDLFDVIQIVPEKSPAIIRGVVAALGVDIDSAWMVGNSVRSDVLPAIDAGLHAVFIPAHVWEYECACDHLLVDGMLSASKLADVLELIAS
jgi:putative hydrolase of the HAD superfamily